MVFPPASCSASRSTSSPWPHSPSPVGQGCPAPGRVSRLNPQMGFHPQICPQSKRFTPMGTVGWSPVTELHVVTSPGELCSAPQVSCQPRLSTSGLSSLCSPLHHLGSSPDLSSPCLVQFQGTGDRAEVALIPKGLSAAPGPHGALGPQSMQQAGAAGPGSALPEPLAGADLAFPELSSPREAPQGRDLPKVIPGHAAGRSGRSGATLGAGSCCPAACGSAQLAN